MVGLRIIFFDAAGTLIGLPQGVEHHYCEVARRHGREFDPIAMHEAFRMAWKEAEPPPTTRAPRDDDDRGWWRRLVDRVLDHCDLSHRDDFNRDAYFDELYVEFTKPGVWDVFPETREVLSTLSQRFELGIISNFDRRLRVILDELGISPLFKHVVISSEVGADKPDPWIFEHALRLAGVEAREALHVGDEPAADWEGAARAGLRVFPLRRPNGSLRDLLTLIESQ
jgi:putative hydrolase of the HAD superfamily